MISYKEIDGRDFYFAFLAGSSWVFKNQVIMNKINVFPVPDGDTGSNLASTFRHIIENAVPDVSIKKTVDSIASAALDGARGNSGIIFAQFLYGLSQLSHKESKINVTRFAQIITNAFRYAFDAIEKPVEGTIITVLRDWINHVNHIKDQIDDFFNMLSESMKLAQKSLQETTQKLEVLKKYNVVDAGAQGFVFFLEGILDFLKNRDIRKILRVRSDKIESPPDVHSLCEIQFRYCAEALIEGLELDKNHVKDIVGQMGDSLVIAGSPRKMRIHLHTNSPATFFYHLRPLGDLIFQKVDDMKRQYETVHARKYQIALVTDSVCDLPDDVMDEYQVHFVPISLHFGKSIFLDKKSITPDQFYDMLENEPQFPTTSQPTAQDFINLYHMLVSRYDSVIAVHMSKQVSGTWNASQKAAQTVEAVSGKKISVLDSRLLSGSLGLLVMRIGESIAAGWAHEEIVRTAETWIEKSSILVSVKTLKYMVKGGRVSPIKGWAAKVLNLKPIISLDKEGKSIPYGKAFSREGNIKRIIKIIRQKCYRQTLWKYVVLHAHDREEAEALAKKLSGVLNIKPSFIIDISPVVGLNAGHGALAVSLMLE